MTKNRNEVNRIARIISYLSCSYCELLLLFNQSRSSFPHIFIVRLELGGIKSPKRGLYMLPEDAVQQRVLYYSKESLLTTDPYDNAKVVQLFRNSFFAYYLCTISAIIHYHYLSLLKPPKTPSLFYYYQISVYDANINIHRRHFNFVESL